MVDQLETASAKASFAVFSVVAEGAAQKAFMLSSSVSAERRKWS